MDQAINYVVVFLYLFSLIAFFLYSFTIIYHLVRFGIGVQPKIIALIFFAGALILVLPSVILYFNLDAVSAVKIFSEKVSVSQFSQ